jgi:hypothetical protein
MEALPNSWCSHRMTLSRAQYSTAAIFFNDCRVSCAARSLGLVNSQQAMEASALRAILYSLLLAILYRQWWAIFYGQWRAVLYRQWLAVLYWPWQAVLCWSLWAVLCRQYSASHALLAVFH